MQDLLGENEWTNFQILLGSTEKNYTWYFFQNFVMKNTHEANTYMDLSTKQSCTTLPHESQLFSYVLHIYYMTLGEQLHRLYKFKESQEKCNTQSQ